MNFYEYLFNFNINPIMLVIIVGIIVVIIVFLICSTLKSIFSHFNKIKIGNFEMSYDIYKKMDDKDRKKLAELAGENFALKFISKPLSDKGIELFKQIHKEIKLLNENENPTIGNYKHFFNEIQNSEIYKYYAKMRNNV